MCQDGYLYLLSLNTFQHSTQIQLPLFMKLFSQRPILHPPTEHACKNAAPQTSFPVCGAAASLSLFSFPGRFRFCPGAPLTSAAGRGGAFCIPRIGQACDSAARAILSLSEPFSCCRGCYSAAGASSASAAPPPRFPSVIRKTISSLLT